MQPAACVGYTEHQARARSPFVFAPSSALTLPKLHPSLPKALPVGKDDNRDQAPTIAKAFVEAGILTPSLWLPGDIHASIERALSDHTSWFKAFGLEVGFAGSLSRLESCLDFKYEPQYDDRGGFALSTAGSIPFIAHADKRLAELERKVPGLGQAILSTLWRSPVSLYTTYNAFGDCCYLQWYHHDNEHDAVKAMLDEGCVDTEEQAWEEIGIRRAEWDKEMPKWAYLPASWDQLRKTRWVMGRLKQLALRGRMSKLFDLLIEVEGYNCRNKDLNIAMGVHGYTHTTTPAIIEWWSFGMVSRLFDDMYNHEMQGGDTDHQYCAVIPFKLDVASIKEALKKFNGLLDHLTKVRQVIELIADERREKP